VRVGHPISFAPHRTSHASWRSLYLRERFLQRSLVPPAELRKAAQDRGLSVSDEDWEFFDEQGALRPVACALENGVDHRQVDPDAPQTVVFRDEHPFRPWSHYAVDLPHDRRRPQPLYSPWQILALTDVTLGRGATLPVDVLLDGRRRRRMVDQLRAWLEAQLQAWQGLDGHWAPTLKLLVELQNRFWPAVSGRIVFAYDDKLRRRDPMPAETHTFDALAVLHRHDLDEPDLAGLYEWLVEAGARIEGGPGGFGTQGGDGWSRLRHLADRRERRALRGPARTAMDFYEAAEVLGRFWHELTGRYLPGIDQVPKRRTTKPIDHDSVTENTHSRRREVLRTQLLARGLWPGRLHAIVEGDTERDWVCRLVETLLGWVPHELLITNLSGAGAAKTMEPIVEAIADYAASTVLIVDDEGDMGRYAHALVEAEVLDPDDVLLVDTSFEEANFSDDELIAVARRLAADPPGRRPAVTVRLTAAELRAEQDRRVAGARRSHEPGLAGTLLELLRDPTYGPVNLSKLELSAGLLDLARQELETVKPIDVALQRPAVRFIYDRVAQRLVDAGWR